MLYHLIVHVSRNINGFWAMCDLSEASVSYVLSTRASAPPRGAYVHYKAPMTGQRLFLGDMTGAGRRLARKRWP